jgi:integrase
VLALVGPVEQIIARRQQRRRLGCELVFHRTSKGRPGQPVEDYRRAFRAALVNAKERTSVGPYDLRRSALRNLIRSGPHETVAMKNQRTPHAVDVRPLQHHVDRRRCGCDHASGRTEPCTEG